VIRPGRRHPLYVATRFDAALRHCYHLRRDQWKQPLGGEVDRETIQVTAVDAHRGPATASAARSSAVVCTSTNTASPSCCASREVSESRGRQDARNHQHRRSSRSSRLEQLHLVEDEVLAQHR
jgi:hypothetical protein